MRTAVNRHEDYSRDECYRSHGRQDSCASIFRQKSNSWSLTRASPVRARAASHPSSHSRHGLFAEHGLTVSSGHRISMRHGRLTMLTNQRLTPLLPPTAATCSMSDLRAHALAFSLCPRHSPPPRPLARAKAGSASSLEPRTDDANADKSFWSLLPLFLSARTKQ